MTEQPEHGPADAVQELLINGVAHLDAIIDDATVRAMRSHWEPIRTAVVGKSEQNSWQTRGSHRYTCNPIVWGAPFLCGAAGGTAPPFWEHPAVVATLEAALGPDYACWGWGCNVPLAGSAYQRWHRDGGQTASGRLELLALEWVLEPVTPEMGAVELLLGSQYLPDQLLLPGLPEPLRLRDDMDRMLSARRSASEGGGWDDRQWADGSAYASHPEGRTRPHFGHTARRLMRPGVCYFRDNRTFHRGALPPPRLRLGTLACACWLELCRR